MPESLEETVCTILSKHANPSGVAIENDTVLREVGIDSYGVIEILFDLEEHFDIMIPNPEDDSALRTAEDVVTEVKNILAENGK
jgi:acyl carrier protein